MTTSRLDASVPGVSGSSARSRPALQILETLRGHYFLIGLGVLTTILRNACALGGVAAGAYLVGIAVNGASLNELQPWLIALGLLVVGRGAAYWLEMWVLHDAAYRILADLRMRLYKRLEQLAPAYLIERRTGDLASTAMADVEATEIFYAHTLNIMIAAIVVPLAGLIVLLSVHPLLALTLAPFLVVAGGVPLLLRQRSRRQGRRLRDQTGEVNAGVVDAVQGLREVVLFGHEREMLERLDRGGRELVSTQYSFARRKGVEGAIFHSVRALAVLAVLAMAANLVHSGELSSSIYPVAVVVALFIFEPVFEMIQIAQNLGQTFAAIGRVLHIYNREPPVRELVSMPPAGSIEPEVRFEGVSFRYGRGLPNALERASFVIRPGETVALVGRSGAGKSTAMSLLMRFWDVTDGRIAIGGHDLRDFPQESLRDMIALVPQDIYLFHMSIRDNIRLGNPEATDAGVEAAARLALADEFIRELPGGYETNAGERGAQLSGGQRQRIAIARALLKDAPILLLDEAVSNLDTENERAMKAAIDRVRENRTTMIIAHRLSTIRDADRIVVLESGRVVESASHAELLRQGGVYSRLVNSQAGGIQL